ncbi:MAG: DUF4907 domain-containing protein [Bacteroidota bacterium]|nr:DUF4907 domain-containing protein [Bacteroidota bacterium]
MTRKGRNILIGIILVTGISIAGIYFWPEGDHSGPPSQKQDKVFVEAQAIQTQTGWGYNIIADHKIYIHQDFIPAIQGYKTFRTREDALKAANLVIIKISSGKLPSLTKKEIDSLKITY